MSITDRAKSRHNTPQLWDTVWDGAVHDNDEDIAAERRSVRWNNISGAILERFGRWDIDVLELGAGSGAYSLLFALLGARVTLVDYSERALDVARIRFERHGLHATYRCANLTAPNTMPDLQADVTMSFGLAEHFRGEERKLVLQRHLEPLRPGGLAIISVPNAWCLPYRIFKVVMEAKREWQVGEEYPFSCRELDKLLREVGAKQIQMTGGSFRRSFRYLAMLPVVRRLRLAEKLRGKSEHASALDKYLAYELVALATR